MFYDGGPYHIETSLLIYRTNKWTGFYMVGTSVMKDLKLAIKMQLLLCFYYTVEKAQLR